MHISLMLNIVKNVQQIVYVQLKEDVIHAQQAIQCLEEHAFNVLNLLAYMALVVDVVQEHKELYYHVLIVHLWLIIILFCSREDVF